MYEYDRTATMSEAHAEWHLNAGVPMGTPGCPQDACHPADDYDYEPEVTPVRCGNVRAHGRGSEVYHDGADGVRACYQGKPGAALAQVTREGQYLPQGPSPEQVEAERQAVEAAEVARIHEQERQQAAARRSRFVAWRSIPVGTGDYANYALQRPEGVVLYQVQRPSTGQYQGKTYVKRLSGEDLVRMPYEEAGSTLDAIARDPMAAAVLYGRKAKRCAICHRGLSDDINKGPDGLTSLQRGIGPVCMTKMGR